MKTLRMTQHIGVRTGKSMIQESTSIPIDQTDGLVNHRFSVEAKVTVFRSLFRGRDDVYPRRFESRRTRKCGHQPACANEWALALCEKPRVKCAECPHRRLLPVTGEAIRWHLSGKDDDGRDFVMGVYPMLQDESCFFLAVDFDKAHWCEVVRRIQAHESVTEARRAALAITVRDAGPNPRPPPAPAPTPRSG